MNKSFLKNLISILYMNNLIIDKKTSLKDMLANLQK